ncbi:MAG: hypothetical protein IJA02_10760 [Clostridia bacterium]|nr:hypothetical protein [Clostridia bacterium]
MKKFSKILAAVLAAVMLLSVSVSAANLADSKTALVEKFVAAEGPKVGNYSVDYRYFSPVKENDDTKYPLVVWLHGMGEGGEEGAQVKKNNIAYWASEEMQARFDPAGGAFILAARSREENGLFWDNALVAPLRAAIDDFVAKNKANIDLSRIYVGGFSMGGKMTYKMAVAYPEMFAAAFPICPAWALSDKAVEKIADMPIWITSSTKDPLVNYYMNVTPTWEKICRISNVAEKCRFSTLTTVCYEDGAKTSSSHHAWFAVNHDMFSVDNGAYPYMSTVNGKGETVELKYPDGMISWLTSHTSDYNGEPGTGRGNLETIGNTDGILSDAVGIFDIIKGIFNTLMAMIFG